MARASHHVRAMWLEAIFSQRDLTDLVDRLLPVRVDIGGGALTLHDPREVMLVPNRGLRVRCMASVEWPVLGIDVPLAIRELSVVIVPEIAPRAGTSALVFRLEIEHADFAFVPTFLDERITGRVNRELCAKRVELAWNFARTLSHVFSLPDTISLVGAIALDVAFGRLRVTEDSIVLAVSLTADVVRERVEPPRAGSSSRTDPGSPGSTTKPVASTRRGRPPRAARARLALGALGLASAAGLYAVMRARH